MRVHRAIPFAELGDRAVRAAVRAALELGGRPDLQVDVVLLDDSAIAELHARFLDDPAPTDVIAFDLSGDGEEGGPQAEIYVSAERARVVASRRGVPVARELALYLVHGALHLCGHDDAEPRARRRMRAAEARVMEALGHPPDPGAHGLGAST